MRKIAPLIMIVTILSLTFSCASLTGSLRIGMKAEPAKEAPRKAPGPAPAAGIGPFRNNEEVALAGGVYRGSVEIRSNSVVLTGEGAGVTVIDGNVFIEGNNCVLRNLTVTGDVVIEGNNSNLKAAEIRGRVTSKGNNNRW